MAKLWSHLLKTSMMHTVLEHRDVHAHLSLPVRSLQHCLIQCCGFNADPDPEKAKPMRIRILVGLGRHKS